MTAEACPVEVSVGGEEIRLLFKALIFILLNEDRFFINGHLIFSTHLIVVTLSVLLSLKFFFVNDARLVMATNFITVCKRVEVVTLAMPAF